MFGRAFTAACAAAVLQFGSFGPALAELPPASSQDQSPVLDDVEISPNGQKLASIAMSGDKRLLTISTVSGEQLIGIDLTGRNVRDIEWAGDSHVLIKTTKTTNLPFLADKAEWPLVQSFNLETRSFATLLADSAGSSQGIRTARSDAALLNVVARGPFVRIIDGRPHVFVCGYTRDYDLEVFEVDLDTGRGVRRKDAGQVMNANGEMIARSEWRDSDGRWRLLARADKGWREVFALTGLKTASPRLYGAGRSPDTVLVGIPEDGRNTVYEISLKDGSKSPVSFGDHDGGAAHPIYDPTTGRLMGFGFPKAEAARYAFVDPAEEAAWASIRTGFDTKRLQLVSWTPDFRQIVVRADSPDGSADFFLVDVPANRATRLGPANRDAPATAAAPPA